MIIKAENIEVPVIELPQIELPKTATSSYKSLSQLSTGKSSGDRLTKNRSKTNVNLCLRGKKDQWSAVQEEPDESPSFYALSPPLKPVMYKGLKLSQGFLRTPLKIVGPKIPKRTKFNHKSTNRNRTLIARAPSDADHRPFSLHSIEIKAPSALSTKSEFRLIHPSVH